MENTNCVVAVLRDTPTVLDTVPRERFLQSQRAVGALLDERNRVMNILIDLVNATAQYRFVDVSLVGEPDVQASWDAAYALCQQWVSVRGNGTAAEQPAAVEKKDIVIPVIGQAK